MFQKRVEEIRRYLLKKPSEGLLISSVSNITHLTGYSNFSIEEREAYLLLTKNNHYIITDGRYKEAVIKHIPHFKLVEKSSKNPFEKIIKKLSKKHKVDTLKIEEDSLTVLEYKKIASIFKKISHAKTHLIRSIKEPGEIILIKEACSLGDKAFEYILTQIKSGVTEKELALKLEIFVKIQGADLSFPSIVAFGKNSSIPHHHTGDTTLEDNPNQLILFDLGTKVDNHCSDMTRTVFYKKASNIQKKIYQTVLEAQQQAVDFINKSISQGKPVKASQVDKVARDYIVKKSYPTIPHSLGHGTGLEVHEHPWISPKSKDILKPGMVFSIEPGIYLPDFGGVRIEDLYLLEEDKLTQLTQSHKNLTEIT